MQIIGKNTLKYIIALSLALGIFGFFNIARAAGTEIIRNFDATVNIETDGSVLIGETVTYDFGSNQKHGIFREIPLTAKNGPRLTVDVLGVSDESGKSYKYSTSVSNDVLQIKIGDPNAFVSGTKIYVIDYEVFGAIRNFDDHDELYWNLTGNGWPVNIQNARAIVTPPDPAITDLKMDCFTGQKGSAEKNCTFSQNGTNVNYSTTAPLEKGSGLTLVFGIPSGYITHTSVPLQRTKSNSETSGNDVSYLVRLIIYIIIIFAVIISVIRRITWKNSRLKIMADMKNQPITVEYNPPDNLSPIEIGTLLDGFTNRTDISSVIMDLAVRGYIKIRYTLKEIPFWPDKKDFELIKLKDVADLKNPADKIIFAFLFENRDNVKLSDLKTRKTAFQKDMKKIKKDLKSSLESKEYFKKKTKIKTKSFKTYLVIIALIFILEALTREIRNSESSIGAAILLTIMIVIIFTINFQSRTVLTPKGISTLQKILGFKEFLQLTEKDKLDLLNAPKLKPEMFEKFLPYAMVLGVEKKWAKKFEGIYLKQPDWYDSPTATDFNSLRLISDISLFNGSLSQITSSQSSSGFGGGGFSGGGSGGGGGGSW